MSEGRIVWFDLETGGLSRTNHQVTQVAAIATSDVYPFKELDWFEIKILLQEGMWEQEALDLNSYDAEVWERDGVEPRYAAESFAAFLRQHATVEKFSKKGNPYKVARLGGHNVGEFDVEFLRSWFGREKKRPDDEYGMFLPATTHHSEVYDTVPGTRWYSFVTGVQLPDLKLATVAAHFGVKFEPHDAKDDTRATLEIARKIYGRFAGRTT